MKWVLVVMAIIAQTSCAVNHRVMVGDEPVIIQQTKGQGKTFVHVHHNEQTALKAAKAVIRKEGEVSLHLSIPAVAI